jgi:hypothetical protein
LVRKITGKLNLHRNPEKEVDRRLWKVTVQLIVFTAQVIGVDPSIGLIPDAEQVVNGKVETDLFEEPGFQ